MPQPKRIYAFTASGNCSKLSEMADEYPNKQTQALILSIEEALDWTSLARKMFNDPPPECLNEYTKWLDQVEDLLEDLQAEIDEDADLAECRQRADEPWYDSVDELLRACPEDEIEFETDKMGGDYEDLRSAFERMVVFWIKNVRQRIVSVQDIMSGDGERLAMLKKYQNL